MKIKNILIGAGCAAILGAVIGQAQVVNYQAISETDRKVIKIETDRASNYEAETMTYKGQLTVGKTDSTILYVGEETGDYAAFCFKTASAVGRKILAVCKNGEQCEFTGQINFESGCRVKNLEADLSASGRIISVSKVKSFAKKGGAVKSKNASNISNDAPDAIIRKLYAADKAGKSPFFQTDSRALVDSYFSRDFADLIWKDAVTANGEVGAIDSDPLYNAQDMKITAFSIGKPEYDTGGESGMATVLVSFKNFGKADTIKYLFARDGAGKWKISDIVFKNGDMLKGILFDSQNSEQ